MYKTRSGLNERSLILPWKHKCTYYAVNESQCKWKPFEEKEEEKKCKTSLS